MIVVCPKSLRHCSNNNLYNFINTTIGKARGNIIIGAKEIEDSKFEVTLQLSAAKLDKKDFFGKVQKSLVYKINNNSHCFIVVDYFVLL